MVISLINLSSISFLNSSLLTPGGDLNSQITCGTPVVGHPKISGNNTYWQIIINLLRTTVLIEGIITLNIINIPVRNMGDQRVKSKPNCTPAPCLCQLHFHTASSAANASPVHAQQWCFSPACTGVPEDKQTQSQSSVAITVL